VAGHRARGGRAAPHLPPAADRRRGHRRSQGGGHRRPQRRPLTTLTRQLDGGITPFELRNLVGNFVLLLPLGIYGPILTPRLQSVPAILLAGAGLSVLIEVGQLAVAMVYGFPVRVADVDDVVLNTLGVLVGFLLWRAWAVTGSVDSDRALRGPAD
jgi:hypothetical protein